MCSTADFNSENKTKRGEYIMNIESQKPITISCVHLALLAYANEGLAIANFHCI